MQKRHPDLPYNLVAIPETLSRGRFIELMGEHRYLLTLSPVEGFGLPSLEAMSRGTTVVGFHGNGGLEYMRDGINCAVAAYPQFDAIADRFAALLRDPRRGEQLAEQGIRDAAGFTKARFEDSWVRYFRETMGLG
jgi:glycosyltransferase involved in cell wall biosynthesis